MIYHNGASLKGAAFEKRRFLSYCLWAKFDLDSLPVSFMEQKKNIRSFGLIKTFCLVYGLTTGAWMFKDCGVELTKAELSGNPALGLKPSHLSAEAESRC